MINTDFNPVTAPILELYTDELPLYNDYVIDSERPISLPEVVKPQVAPPVVVAPITSPTREMYNSGFSDVNPDNKPFVPDVFSAPITKRPKPAVYVADVEETPIVQPKPTVAAKKPLNLLYIVGAVVAVFIIYKLIK